MTFVADESVDRQIVEAVRGLGFDVLFIAESDPGIADDEVLSRAERRGSVLLTADKDFGELVFRQRRLHTGVLLFRLAGFPPEAKAQIAATAIESHARELHMAFAVLTDKSLRIRRTDLI